MAAFFSELYSEKGNKRAPANLFEISITFSCPLSCDLYLVLLLNLFLSGATRSELSFQPFFLQLLIHSLNLRLVFTFMIRQSLFAFPHRRWGGTLTWD